VCIFIHSNKLFGWTEEVSIQSKRYRFIFDTEVSGIVGFVPEYRLGGLAFGVKVPSVELATQSLNILRYAVHQQNG
jgi:hypothetical protein